MVAPISRPGPEQMHAPVRVVDIAKTTSRHWILVQCNDSREAGRGGCSSVAMLNRGGSRRVLKSGAALHASWRGRTVEIKLH